MVQARSEREGSWLPRAGLLALAASVAAIAITSVGTSSAAGCSGNAQFCTDENGNFSYTLVRQPGDNSDCAWDISVNFGDGTSGNYHFDGTPLTASHHFPQPGIYFVVAAATNGQSPSMTFTCPDYNVSAAVEYPAPAVALSKLPAPKPGESVNVSLVSGSVFVRLPGSGEFVPLTSARQIPVGSILDTTGGRVRIESADGTGGGTQTGEFYRGVFRILQPNSGKVTILKLVDDAAARFIRERAALARAKRNGLWGDGKGNFKSKGKHGSASVRGTIWFTQDRPNGTFFRVKRGVVRVRDFTNKRAVKVRAGEHYLAPAH